MKFKTFLKHLTSFYISEPFAQIIQSNFHYNRKQLSIKLYAHFPRKSEVLRSMPIADSATHASISRLACKQALESLIAGYF